MMYFPHNLTKDEFDILVKGYNGSVDKWTIILEKITAARRQAQTKCPLCDASNTVRLISDRKANKVMNWMLDQCHECPISRTGLCGRNEPQSDWVKVVDKMYAVEAAIEKFLEELTETRDEFIKEENKHVRERKPRSAIAAFFR